MTVDITLAELQSFTTVLYQKYGIDFTGYETQSLTRRMKRVLYSFHCENIHELWSKMLKDEQLIYRFMDEISVGLTAMFRDPAAWIGLRGILQKYENARSINIWCAGCSTGEEVYTLAVVLNELNLLQKTKIYATDMNQTALANAKAGKYHQLKVSEYERNYREYNRFSDFSQYYDVQDDYAYMHSWLTKNVIFNYHNLITDQFMGCYDLIFSRNVLIYFDQDVKEKMIKQFYNCLNPGGYYIMGFYDSLLPDHIKQQFNNEQSFLRIFRKPAEAIQFSA